MEHCTSLQDVDVLENQVYKYQMLLKSEEVVGLVVSFHLFGCFDNFFAYAVEL